jgi:hypothetical protein
MPDSRGRISAGVNGLLSRQSLPTDPVGVFSLTLTNVIVGSAISVRDQAGTTTLHSSTATGSTVVIPLQSYAPGSPLNNLRVRVRKGTAAPFFQPYETLTTSFVGAQSIFVSQIPD